MKFFKEAFGRYSYYTSLTFIGLLMIYEVYKIPLKYHFLTIAFLVGLAEFHRRLEGTPQRVLFRVTQILSVIILVLGFVIAVIDIYSH